LDEVFSRGIISLKIYHSMNLSRVQKRKSIRIKVNEPAFMYLVGEDEPHHRMEFSGGLRCILENLSDSGYAIIVGGAAHNGMRVKVQFELGNSAVCISGTTRDTVHFPNAGRSILHVEADPLPTEVRNRILGRVFGAAQGFDDAVMSFAEEAESPSSLALDDFPDLGDDLYD